MAKAFTSLWIVLAAAVSLTVSGQSVDQGRVALVIGNAAYRQAPLRNPVNDARAVAATLAELGFDVIAIEDADRSTMQQAILDFSARLNEGSVGLFYFAGHGIQARAENYLIPIDAELHSESALKFQAVPVQAVLEEMAFARNRVNIVILDACRNNPFERRFRGAPRGLAAIDAAHGTIIAYATAPGSVAADGDGSNGLYTAALLEALEVPGLEAEDVFKRVRVAVARQTNNHQVPWESSSLTGKFVFNRSAGAPASVARTTPRADREALFWETIKGSDNPDDFAAYLNRYPDGTFAELARIRIQTLRGDESSTRSESLAHGDNLESALEHPKLLSGNRREKFQDYWELTEGEYFAKVFAMSEDDAWGYRTGPTLEAAERAAIAGCERHSSGPCRSFAVGNSIVWDLPADERARVIEAYREKRSPWPENLEVLRDTPMSISAYKNFLSYEAYDAGEKYKIFVLAEDGAWSKRTRTDLDIAIKAALEGCEKHTSLPGSCRLLSVGNTVVWSLSDAERERIIAEYRKK